MDIKGVGMLDDWGKLARVRANRPRHRHEVGKCVGEWTIVEQRGTARYLVRCRCGFEDVLPESAFKERDRCVRCMKAKTAEAMLGTYVGRSWKRIGYTIDKFTRVIWRVRCVACGDIQDHTGREPRSLRERCPCNLLTPEEAIEKRTAGARLSAEQKPDALIDGKVPYHKDRHCQNVIEMFPEMCYEDIALLMGISRQRVEQIALEALEKLFPRAQLMPDMRRPDMRATTRRMSRRARSILVKRLQSD